MTTDEGPITVFYDGACPSCVKDRRFYEWLAGQNAQGVSWQSIEGYEQELNKLGIDPMLAMRELHLQLANGQIVSELDAYIVLMSRVPVLKPVAWFMGRAWVRPWLAKLYHYRVERRLKASGRI